jgi:hypothetical protein
VAPYWIPVKFASPNAIFNLTSLSEASATSFIE